MVASAFGHEYKTDAGGIPVWRMHRDRLLFQGVAGAATAAANVSFAFYFLS